MMQERTGAGPAGILLGALLRGTIAQIGFSSRAWQRDKRVTPAADRGTGIADVVPASLDADVSRFLVKPRRNP
jgi:hypothetical protein